MNKAIEKFRNSPRVSRLHAALFALTVAVVSSPVFATPPAEFDTAPILAKITTFAGYAAACIAGMLAARWGKHLFGLLSPKG